MRATNEATLKSWLEASPFQGYAYAYPHKTAYRKFPEAIPLSTLWKDEDRQHLFLYLHVPFCEMRCGFCNLFTTARPEANRVGRWLDAMLRQARAVREALGDEPRFARGAIGGGTPTFLERNELQRLLEGMRRLFGAGLDATPFSVEMSPATVTAEKLSLLREHGMQRASLGVQSFVESEVRTAGRAQREAEVNRTLELMARSGVPVRNVDLIYGIPGQTLESWKFSLARAAAHAPEEIYLYPLYVRPLTGLDRAHRLPDDNRGDLYRFGRDWLCERGYRQISMRLFRAQHCAGPADPPYVCQEDGMVGLGPGARSYTRGVHYSSDYAVARASVVEIIEDFSAREESSYGVADYGARLDPEEQKRRYLIKSVLRVEGLEWSAYRQRFDAECLTDWPVLAELSEHGLATIDDNGLRLTSEGLAWSDAIGPWLYSEAMRRQMDEFEWS